MSSATLTAPIKIRPETKDRLEASKVYPRETIDDVVTRLLDEHETRKPAKKRAS